MPEFMAKKDETSIFMERIDSIPAFAFMGSEIARAERGKAETLNLSRAQACWREGKAVMICHDLGMPPELRAQLGEVALYDVMELWAFI